MTKKKSKELSTYINEQLREKFTMRVIEHFVKLYPKFSEELSLIYQEFGEIPEILEDDVFEILDNIDWKIASYSHRTLMRYADDIRI